MFWSGLIGTYVVIALLIIGVKYRGEKFNLRIKEIACTVLFTASTFIFSLIYSLITIQLGTVIMSAVLCSFCLVVSWIIVEKFYQQISNKEKILFKEDKNICHLFALIGMGVSGILLWGKNLDSEYGILVSVSISIFVGAYVPLGSIYDGDGIKKTLCKVREHFSGSKITVWITSFLSIFLVVMVLLSKELENIIDEISIGIAVGSLTIIPITVIIHVIRKKVLKVGTKESN